jgi:hypothetical protein
LKTGLRHKVELRVGRTDKWLVVPSPGLALPTLVYTISGAMPVLVPHR